MKKIKNHMIGIAGIIALLLASQSLTAADAPYHLLTTIPVHGEGAWTAMAVDEAAQRLYAAHGSRIEVINLSKGSPLGAITDIADVRDFIIVPNFRLGYASSGKTDEACLVDLINLRATAKMNTGKNPGPIVYEPSRLEIYAFNQGDHSATAGEADDGDYEATIDLESKPACAVADNNANYESKKGRVFVGLEDKNEIAVINAQTRKVTDHWSLEPGKMPKAIAYDAENNRLLIACANKLLVVMNSTNGNVAATAPIGMNAGKIVFDAASHDVFCAAADGTLTILHQDAPDKLTVVQTLKTKPDSSVLGIDGKSHKIYVGTADFTRITSNPIPNSLKIMVYGM